MTNLSSRTNICFSPDQKVILTGTSVRKGYGYGHIMGFNTLTGEKVVQVPLCEASVITLFWHPEIN